MHRNNDLQSRHGLLKGQVIILFALASVLLIGMMALAVDVGFMLAERRQTQAAADAGAMAAAQASIAGVSWDAAGRTYASANADVPAANVAVNNPPTQGRFAGDTDYIEVVVTKDVQRFFLGAIYNGDWEVTSRAVALAGTVQSEVALLALNPDSGGIHTSGSSYIETIGGSMQSNFNINASGHSTFTTTHQIISSNGIQRSGTVITNAGQGVLESGTNAPDPLEEMLQPPTLPSSPGNIVPNVNPPAGTCYTLPTWYQSSGVYEYTGRPGSFTSGGGGCVTVQGVAGGVFTFPNNNYRFSNGAGVSLPYTDVLIDRGTWNFNGGPGISVNGTTHSFEMRNGNYSFLNGATLSISGNAPNNTLGGNFYFHGGGGIESSGTNHITLYPGRYVFDGGPGLQMSGDARLHLTAGNYEFWFLNGADMTFSGRSIISSAPGAHARMYFYGTQSNSSNLSMSGNSDMVMPSGQYYFDRGNFTASGSSRISAQNVFFYFTNGGHMRSNGMAGFAFTAPTAQLYPGYVPGVFVYSDRSNTAEFEWTGYTGAVSQGIVYLPSSPVVMSGYSNGKVFEGQFIADSFRLSGNNRTVIEYVQYIENDTPQVFLVD